MPAKCNGTGIIAIWDRNIEWSPGKGLDINHNHFGITKYQCADDPLWEPFGPLLPYMSKTAVISKLSYGDQMYPHVDRAWRPNAIYMPIVGCSDQCESGYYDFPISDSINRQVQVNRSNPQPLYRYAIDDNGYLTNVHLWHSVKNNGQQERISFGWNFSAKHNTFNMCKDVLANLDLI